MTLDWCPGIREACGYWRVVPMLQQKFEALQTSLEGECNASIDAAKGLVESVCRAVIAPLEFSRLHYQPDRDAYVAALNAARGATAPAAAPVEE